MLVAKNLNCLLHLSVSQVARESILPTSYSLFCVESKVNTFENILQVLAIRLDFWQINSVKFLLEISVPNDSFIIKDEVATMCQNTNCM